MEKNVSSVAEQDKTAEVKQKSKEAGMDAHLSKPVDIAALEQTVKRFRVTPPQLNSGIARFRR